MRNLKLWIVFSVAFVANAQRSNNDYTLINSQIVTVTGTVVRGQRVPSGPHAGAVLPDSCSITVTLPAGQNAVEGRAKSATTFNGNACQLQMEIGEPPASAIQSAPAWAIPTEAPQLQPMAGPGP